MRLAVGMLPGMFSIYSFMTVAAGVVIYWTILGLVEMPIKGLIIAAIYGE
jgi:membrane protein insertase Oxa1/YidC/SpoIIIJ